MSSQEVVDFVRTRLAQGNRNPEELTAICEAVSIQMPSPRVNTRWKPTLPELYSVSKAGTRVSRLCRSIVLPLLCKCFCPSCDQHAERMVGKGHRSGFMAFPL